ncbi:hypothetical protein Ddc_12938 [Ditylenchus destructor]|nr:hypothetical protein Ddc_12938 [Ditylenchus destructor]
MSQQADSSNHPETTSKGYGLSPKQNELAKRKGGNSSIESGSKRARKNSMSIMVPVEVFAFYSRLTLSKQQLVSKRFSNIITTYFFKYPYIRLYWVSIECARLYLQLYSESEDGYYSSSTKTIAQLMPPFLFGGDNSFDEEEESGTEGSDLDLSSLSKASSVSPKRNDEDSNEPKNSIMDPSSLLESVSTTHINEESNEVECSVMDRSSLPESFSISPDYVAPYVRFDNLTIDLDDCFSKEILWNKILKHEHLFKPELPHLFINIDCDDWWKHWDTVRALDLLVDDLWISFVGEGCFDVSFDGSVFDSQVVQNCKHLSIRGIYEPKNGFIKCEEVAEWLHASPTGNKRELVINPKYLKEGVETLQQLLVQAFQSTPPMPGAHDYICFLDGVDSNVEIAGWGMPRYEEFRKRKPVRHTTTNVTLYCKKNQVLRTSRKPVYKLPDDDIDSLKIDIGT